MISTYGLLVRANLRIPHKRTNVRNKMFKEVAKSMPNNSQKNNIRKIVKSTLQNTENLHFFIK